MSFLHTALSENISEVLRDISQQMIGKTFFIASSQDTDIDNVMKFSDSDQVQFSDDDLIEW